MRIKGRAREGEESRHETTRASRTRWGLGGGVGG